MISRPTNEQMLALSGLFQSCQLVYQLAHHGTADSAQMEACMNALLNQNPHSVEQLYGDSVSMAAGREAMRSVLSKNPAANSQQILGYVLSVLHLERKLSSKPAMLDKVGQGIHRAASQAELFSVTHDNVYASVADLYQQTISTFGHRVQVSGNPTHLQQAGVANRIRSLLFAAVRSAVLWRQLGGKRYHLIFYRAQLLNFLKQVENA